MHITLGSTSEHKLAAVVLACRRLGLSQAAVEGVKTSSGQNEQPVGFDETFGGALQRATSAQIQKPNTIAIGIESGIFRFKAVGTKVTLDIAVIVILTIEGRKIITTSSGIQFPEEYVNIAEGLGFKTVTAGSVVSDKLGGDPTDPHSTLTEGCITRRDTLVDALAVALKQLIGD